MTRKLKILSLIILILAPALLLAYTKSKADAPIRATVPEAYEIYLSGGHNQVLERLDQYIDENAKGGEYGDDAGVANAPFFVNMSEQQLLAKSALEFHNAITSDINQDFMFVPTAMVNIADRTVTVDGQDLAFTVDGEDSAGRPLYTLTSDSDVISDNNLSVLIRNGASLIEARNNAYWSRTWLAIAYFIGLFTIGVLILFNLDSLSTWTVGLYIKGAEPGPMIKIGFAVSAVTLIIVGFMFMFITFTEIG